MGINTDSSVITDKAELENSQLLPCLKRPWTLASLTCPPGTAGEKLERARWPAAGLPAALVLRPVRS